MDNWARYKDIIMRLHDEERLSRGQIRQHMESNHGFKASTRAYKAKFIAWGLQTEGTAADDDDNDLETDNFSNIHALQRHQRKEYSLGLLHDSDETSNELLENGCLTPRPVSVSYDAHSFDHALSPSLALDLGEYVFDVISPASQDWPSEAIAVQSREGAATVYSTATSVAPVIGRKAVTDICNDIYGRLHQSINEDNWRYITDIIPDHIRALAIRFGCESSEEWSRQVMCFVHKRHIQISARLKALFSPEDPGARKKQGDMSLQEKLKMWKALLQTEDTQVMPADQFEGVEDEDEPNQHELFTYCRALAGSACYKWLISSLIKASMLHWDDAGFQMSVRSLILAALPTGTLSRKQAPSRHTACFEMPKMPFAIRLSEERGRRNVKQAEETILGALVVVGSSLNQVQITTVKEYLDQTWSMGWPELISMIGRTMDDTQRIAHQVKLADTTLITAACGKDSLFVSVEGPAYSLAECGEQLSWLCAALLPGHLPISYYSTPYVTYSPPPQAMKQPLHHWKITSTRSGLTGISPLSELPSRLWHGGDLPNFVVHGFPTAKRPDSNPGVEVPASLLNNLRLREEKNETKEALSPHCEIRLSFVEKKQHVMVWHITEPHARSCTCRDQQMPESVQNEDEVFFLVGGQARHIINICSGMKATVVPPTNNSSSHQQPEVFLRMPSTPTTGLERLEEDTSSVLDSAIMSMSDPSEIIPIASPMWSSSTLLAGARLDHEQRVSISPSELVRKQCLQSAEASMNNQFFDSKEADAIHGNLVPEPHGTKPAAKRPRPDSSDDSNGESKGSAKSEAKIKKGAPDTKLWACPFWRNTPSKHSRCFKVKLDTVSRVKSHLNRTHWTPLYCQRCKRKFADEKKLQSHIANPCPMKPASQIDISHAQYAKLSKRFDGDIPEPERWFYIWGVLFPDKQPPSSPYVEKLSEDFFKFIEYCQKRGQSRAVRSQGDLVSQLESMMPRLVLQWVEDWQSSLESAASTSTNHDVSLNMAEGASIVDKVPSVAESSRSLTDSGIDVQSQAAFANLLTPKQAIAATTQRGSFTALNDSVAENFSSMTAVNGSNFGQDVDRELMNPAIITSEAQDLDVDPDQEMMPRLSGSLSLEAEGDDIASIRHKRSVPNRAWTTDDGGVKLRLGSSLMCEGGVPLSQSRFQWET